LLRKHAQSRLGSNWPALDRCPFPTTIQTHGTQGPSISVHPYRLPREPEKYAIRHSHTPTISLSLPLVALDQLNVVESELLGLLGLDGLDEGHQVGNILLGFRPLLLGQVLVRDVGLDGAAETEDAVV
jgi:hypothetical protein